MQNGSEGRNNPNRPWNSVFDGWPQISRPNGRWDAEDFGAGQVDFDENGVDREFAGQEADTGLTALVMLSFLGAGYTHEEGRYAVEVDRALDWLISQQARRWKSVRRCREICSNVLPRDGDVFSGRSLWDAEGRDPRASRRSGVIAIGDGQQRTCGSCNCPVQPRGRIW